MTTTSHRADAIVVLGRAINADGSLPLTAAMRVERAAALWALGVAPRVVFSGRCSLMATPPPAVTEAAAMARHAETLGVPREAMVLEEESRDTIGNAYFVGRRWLEPNDWRAVRVVTSDFHVPRTAWVFQKVLGPTYDVSFSPASSELFASTVAARAREESDIASFLMEWIGPLPDGDREALDRFIHERHPGYAPAAPMTTADIQARIAEIAKAHRVIDGQVRGHRTRQERLEEF